MSTSLFVLLGSWISLFVLAWLMILRVIPRTDLFTWGFFVGFIVLAFLSAAMKDTKK